MLLSSQSKIPSRENCGKIFDNVTPDRNSKACFPLIVSSKNFLQTLVITILQYTRWLQMGIAADDYGIEGYREHFLIILCFLR